MNTISLPDLKPSTPTVCHKFNRCGKYMLCTLLLTGNTACRNSKTDTANEAVQLSNTWTVLEAADPTGAWLRAFTPEDTPDTLWIIGGQPTKGAIKVGNAIDGFTNLSLPEDTPLLNWADGTSTDMWVGGLYGTLIHWDGSVWSDHSLDIEEAIWGIEYVQPDEVVAVGGISRWGGSKGILLKKQGDGWLPVSIPTQVADNPNWFKVAYDGEAFWIVGTSGGLLYGTIPGGLTETGDMLTSELTPIPTGIAKDLITVVETSSDTVHIVGGRGTGIFLEGHEGGISSPLQLIAGINGVVERKGSSLLVGEMGFASFYDGEFFEDIPSMTQHILHAAAVQELNGQTFWYAVGGNLATASTEYEGSILVLETEDEE